MGVLKVITSAFLMQGGAVCQTGRAGGQAPGALCIAVYTHAAKSIGEMRVIYDDIRGTTSV